MDQKVFKSLSCGVGDLQCDSWSQGYFCFLNPCIRVPKFRTLPIILWCYKSSVHSVLSFQNPATIWFTVYHLFPFETAAPSSTQLQITLNKLFSPICVSLSLVLFFPALWCYLSTLPFSIRYRILISTKYLSVPNNTALPFLNIISANQWLTILGNKSLHVLHKKTEKKAAISLHRDGMCCKEKSGDQLHHRKRWPFQLP